MKPSKKKNKPCIIDGIPFASQVEGRYYEYLKREKEAGRVYAFELQPKMEIQAKFEHHTGEKVRAITYILDFYVRYDYMNGAYIDVKGQPTPDAKIKRKMFMKEYPEENIAWIAESKKWGDKDGWIDWFALDKIRRSNKNKS